MPVKLPAMLLASLAAAYATPAAAQDLEFELTAFGAARFGGNFALDEPVGEYELDDSASFGLILNWRHGVNTQWEILYSRQSSTAVFDNPAADRPDADVEVHVLQLGGTYLGDGDTVYPYLAATLGGTHVRTRSGNSDSDTFFSGSIGLGVKFMPSEQFGLRLEARAYGTLIDSSTDLFCSTGPDENVCAIQVRGESLTQVETFAGVVFRF